MQISGAARGPQSLELRFDRLETRLAALTTDIDLPPGTALSDYVATIAKRHTRSAGTGSADAAVALLRRDMNTGLKEVEDEMRQLGRQMAAVPSGTIVTWNSTRAVPAGWAECNGRNGTPDLRNRFLYGASNASYVGQKGGGGGGSASHRDHWHHSDTWTNTEWQGRPALIFVQGAAHAGKNVYALYGHHGYASGGSAMPAYTTVRFIMKL